MHSSIDSTELVGILSDDGALSFNFVALTLASCAIATFGLLENNVAVIIGAMIIAPFIAPIGSVSFGAVDGNARMIWRGAMTLAAGSVISVVLAGILTRLCCCRPSAARY